MSLDVHTEVELMDHTTILFFILSATGILFYTVAVPFYIPINDARMPQFPYILINTYYFLFLILNVSF